MNAIKSIIVASFIAEHNYCLGFRKIVAHISFDLESWMFVYFFFNTSKITFLLGIYVNFYI